MSRVYIESNGCAVLRHDTYRLGKYFSVNGWEEVDRPAEAEMVVYTGCGVIDLTQLAAVTAIQRLVGEARPTADVVVAGCLPSIDREAIEAISPRLLLIENKNMGAFDELIHADVALDDVVYNNNPLRVHSLGIPVHEPHLVRSDDDQFLEELPERARERFADAVAYTTKARHLFDEPDLFEIRATWGCARKCGFCAIKLAIGEIRSKSVNDIVREARDGIELGYKKLMLMGDEVGYYGRDLDLRLPDLIDALRALADELDSDVRIGLRYVFPDALVQDYERLKPHFASGFIYYFCSAFQSGSHSVLRRMNRNPNLEPFINVIADLNHNRFPVYKHTQVIVGYPGETEGDLLSTVRALTRGSFDFVTLAIFSARKGTKAADLPDQLPQEVKQERFDFMTQWLEVNRSAKLYEYAKSFAVIQ